MAGRSPSSAVLREWSDHLRSQTQRTVEQSLLRHRSTAIQHVLAAAAGVSPDSGVDRDRLASIGRNDVGDRFLESLALVVGRQNLGAEDDESALEIYRALAHRRGYGWLRGVHRVAFAELALLAGDVATARAVIAGVGTRASTASTHQFLQLDVLNPALAGSDSMPAWRALWESLFDAHGLRAPDIADDAPTPFDGLRGQVERPRSWGPLISVILTAFQPGPELFSAVASVLDQSWLNFELVIVDDASGSEYDDIFERVASLDDRIRVLRLAENGGTYVARNVGIAAARGTIIAGQDSDDWSHPLRLERQVRPLLDDPAVAATRCDAWTVSPDLVFHRRGFWPQRHCEASLMVRRSVVETIGGYLPSRRGADSEFTARLRATGAIVLDSGEPLWLTRIVSNSLSRPDFLAGWHHPARLAFRGSMEEWHARVRTGRSAPTSGPVEVRVPVRFAVSAPSIPASYDLVVGADWRFDGPTARLWLEILAAAAGRGLRVAATQLDNPWHLVRATFGTCRRVAAAQNAGVFDVVPADEVCTARLLVVADPMGVQFLPDAPLGIAVDQIAAVACRPPQGLTGQMYDVGECDAILENRLGRRARWFPVSGETRDVLIAAGVDVAAGDFDAAVDSAAWKRSTRGAGGGPVVGWICPELWPGAEPVPDTVRALGTEVRALISARLHRGRSFGSGVLVLDDENVSVEEFLRQVDVLALDLDGSVESRRLALEARASGVDVRGMDVAQIPMVSMDHAVDRLFALALDVTETA